MNKKLILLLSSGALIALLVVGLTGTTVVSAEEDTPPPPDFPDERAMGTQGFGGHGGFGGRSWETFDTAAEALGLTPVEFFTELHDGKSLPDIAEEQGIEIEAVHETLNAARNEARQQAIEQAVEDGKISQEQADWMLEGLEKGFAPGGRGGFGRGRGQRLGK